MFISKEVWDRTVKNTDDGWKVAREFEGRCNEQERHMATLESQVKTLAAQIGWFQLRLNHVELERAQLISAAIGVKVTVPQFLPAQEKEGQALNEMPDLSSIGADAVEEGEPLIPGEGANGVDYTMMPGYRKNR